MATVLQGITADTVPPVADMLAFTSMCPRIVGTRMRAKLRFPSFGFTSKTLNASPKPYNDLLGLYGGMTGEKN